MQSDRLGLFCQSSIPPTSPFASGRKTADLAISPHSQENSPTPAITYSTSDGQTHVLYQPTVKQLEFHSHPAKYRLLSGSAGTGKSVALRMEAYMRCQQIPGYRCLILRRTLGELKDTHIREVMTEGPKLGLDMTTAWRQGDLTLTFPNGSTIQFGHCHQDRSVNKYLSVEFDLAGFDELTTFKLDHFRMISSRVGRRKNMPATVIAGTNPIGPGQAWVKRLFIDKAPHSDEVPDDGSYNPDDYHNVHVVLADNPHLPKDYGQLLSALPRQALRDAYRDGSWDAIDGQAFREWDPAIHVLSTMPTIGGVPLADVPWLEWFRAADWGWSDPTVVGWYACLPNGRIVKVFEREWTETPASQIARDVLSFTRKHIKGRVRYTVLDPKAFTPEGSRGETVSESFGRAGLPCRRADNNRLNGWARLHTWLTQTHPDDGLPMLQVYGPGCQRTVDTLPTLVVHKTKSDDIAPSQDDHAADETRYALMSRPMPSRQPNSLPTADLATGQVQLATDPELQRFLRRRRSSSSLTSRFSLAA